MHTNKPLYHLLAVAILSLTIIIPTVQAGADLPATALPVPLFRQEKPLSCEIASLKMALHYKGSPVSEEQLLAIIGYDPTPRAGNHWGDPDQNFVGNISGKQNSTGYGVHWHPIARAAQVFYPDSRAFAGWNSAQVAQNIAAGHPVIIWGVSGKAKADGWYTPDGRFVRTWVGEHTRVVVGFTGSAENPQSFILHDSISGKMTWTKRQFERNWAAFGNAGVVVK